MNIENYDDDEVPILVSVVPVDDDFDDDEDAPQLVVVQDENEGGDQQEREAEEILRPADPQLPPCPVTILSGFLGSGKTTFIQYILQSPDHGKRIAVIENEFGGGAADGVSVESMIARDGASNQSLADLIELPNGCVCCTVKDNLVQTLENLLEKRKDLDYILIESSGMANPGPIASVFWLDDALESRLRLDGIVTIVDAHHIMHQLQETEEAAQQIAYADRVLLNKVDLVDAKKQEQVMMAIQTINMTAPTLTTTYSQIPDLDWILDSDSYGRGAQNIAEGKCSSQSIYCMPVETTHKHTSAVGTLALNQMGTVHLKKLNAWLASLLWPNQDEEDRVLRARLESADTVHHVTANDDTMQLYRMKGILSVKPSNPLEDERAYVDSDGIDRRRYVVQAVYDTWEIHPASDNLNWEPDEKRRCKIIVIGRNLQFEELQTGFNACFAR